MASTPSFPFTRLPPELRLNVYDHVLDDFLFTTGGHLQVEIRSKSTSLVRWTLPLITQASRGLRADTLHLVYKHAKIFIRFQLDPAGRILSFVLRNLQKIFEQIQMAKPHITFDMAFGSVAIQPLINYASWKDLALYKPLVRFVRELGVMPEIREDYREPVKSNFRLSLVGCCERVEPAMRTLMAIGLMHDSQGNPLDETTVLAYFDAAVQQMQTTGPGRKAIQGIQARAKLTAKRRAEAAEKAAREKEEREKARAERQARRREAAAAALRRRAEEEEEEEESVVVEAWETQMRIDAAHATVQRARPLEIGVLGHLYKPPPGHAMIVDMPALGKIVYASHPAHVQAAPHGPPFTYPGMFAVVNLRSGKVVASWLPLHMARLSLTIPAPPGRIVNAQAMPILLPQPHGYAQQAAPFTSSRLADSSEDANTPPSLYSGMQDEDQSNIMSSETPVFPDPDLLDGDLVDDSPFYDFHGAYGVAGSGRVAKRARYE